MQDFSIRGLNHLGLVVSDIQKAKEWFLEDLGFELMEDRGELVFLWVGGDILAIKTPAMAINKPEHGGESLAQGGDFTGWQHLDHYGFYAGSPGEVDRFADFLKKKGLPILKGPYDRKDGRSVYFRDPCGLVGEYLYCTGGAAPRPPAGG
jgi:catechol 2,3-dioxygenase-like lactoylglutathione lyase family enzyme